MRYDRAGRSEGLAYVTYEHPEDARQAIRDFDGANANGELAGPFRIYTVVSDSLSRPTYPPDAHTEQRPWGPSPQQEPL